MGSKIETGNERARSLLARGRRELERHESDGYERAVVLFLESIEADNDCAEAQAGLAEAYAYWGFRREISGLECQSYFDLAYDRAETALALAPEQASSHRAMATALRRGEKADPKRRQEEALVALDLDPNGAENWLEHWRAFGYDLSDNAIFQAIDLNPKLIAAHIDIGAALCEGGRLPEAFRHFIEALRVNPRNSLVQYDLAMVLDRMGERERACGTLEKARKMHPDDPLVAEGIQLLS